MGSIGHARTETLWARGRIDERPRIATATIIAGFTFEYCCLEPANRASHGIAAVNRSGGMRTPLASVKPDQVEEKGAFRVTWNYRKNQSIDGSALTVGGQRVRHGLAVHSYARLTWNVDKAYSIFRTGVAIDDDLGDEGDCIVRVSVDGSERWRARVRGGEALRRINIDLTGAKTLSLEVDFGERFDIGDHVVFAEAEMIAVDQ